MDFIFTRKNLHLLEDYIYYDLQLCLLWIYEVTFIIDLYLKTFQVIFTIIKDRVYEDIFIYCIYLSICLWYLLYFFIYFIDWLIDLYILFIYLFIYLLIYQLIDLSTYLLIYLFNYLFTRKLYLLEVMLLDWIIKLKRSIIYVLLQIVISRRFSMSVIWNILCILPCSVNLTR